MGAPKTPQNGLDPGHLIEPFWPRLGHKKAPWPGVAARGWEEERNEWGALEHLQGLKVGQGVGQKLAGVFLGGVLDLNSVGDQTTLGIAEEKVFCTQ